MAFIFFFFRTNDSRKLLLASTWDGGIYRMELNGTDKQLVHAVNGKHLTITWDRECKILILFVQI